MAAANTAWGIDIGQSALKAIQVRRTDEQVLVESFEVIEHSSVLSQPDVDADIIIHQTLDELLRRVDLSDASVSVSVLGQSAFTRFVPLPPVEPKKIPEIVRFEAEQQIPFPIDEVIWRYQTFQDPDSPQVEVGIFAMKQADVGEMLAHFTQAGLDIDIVQMAPLSLYNFMAHDHQIAPEGATLLADVGADKTHLVVADGARIWTRTIQIGGNNFTEALVKSFKLSFPKAEKLKRTAAASKYAREIFRVMRPVFADLVQEIQRSIGYYTSLHREARFKQLVGMGNGFRLPGMHKYLEQNLNMPVARIEQFQNVTSNQEHLNEHVLSLGVAYGLALQALDLAPVQTNLLPEEIVRKRLWGKKKPWFAFAAAAVVLAVGLYTFRAYNDLASFDSPAARRAFNDAKSIESRLQNYRSQSRQIATSVDAEKQHIRNNLSLRAYSTIWPAINSHISNALLQTMVPEKDRQILQAFETASPEQKRSLVKQIRSDQTRLELIGRLGDGAAPGTDGKSLRQTLLEQLAQKSRNNRGILILQQLASQYQYDIRPIEEKTDTSSGGPGGAGGFGGPQPGRPPGRKTGPEGEPKPGFLLELTLRTPLAEGLAVQKRGELAQTLKRNLNEDPNLEVLGDVSAEPLEQDGTGARRTPTARRRPTAPGPGMMDPGIGMEAPRAARTAGAPTGTDSAEPAIDPQWQDPLFDNESMQNDVTFRLTIRLAVVDDGLDLPGESDEQASTNQPRPGRSMP